MKAIVVMFDSLNRRMLAPYGCDWAHTPNFARLAQRTATFDNCYAGSMPCMPARRELHTGRHNFLHRSWGPLEPFDDSVPEMLSDAGVYAHLVTDHYHYWEDGGGTYHNRFDSYELFRGQESDAWKGVVAEPDRSNVLKRGQATPVRRHLANQPYMAEESQHSQTLTFKAGLEFIDQNHSEDRWLVQIESFDPHEPFFSPRRFQELHPHEYDGPDFSWPDYGPVTETPEQVAHARNEYLALLSMCDESLGRVLDTMDRHGLWDDTLLIVCTDHGYMLAERGWWAKTVTPWYDDTIHTPLFIWDPRSGVAGERRESLVETIDIGPTLLDFFGVACTPDMQGRPLGETVAGDEQVHATALFGSFGGHVSITDGRYVYMRAPANPGNEPLLEHTVMPTHMARRFAPEELRGAELVEPFEFTKGVPLLRIPGHSVQIDPYQFGTQLFDLESDPDQRQPLIDDELELKLAAELVARLRESDAPPSQYERLGLPRTGPVTDAHLLARKQSQQVQDSAGLAGNVAQLARFAGLADEKGAR
jgi:arylsulfatase A-like enzyme